MARRFSKKDRRKRVRKLLDRLRVTDGRGFRLKDYDPGDTDGVDSKEKAVELLAQGVNLLSEGQEKLYAQDQWGVLLIFQAMDAAGKDGAIKHVMSGVNPQGCQVFSFKAPSAEELDHDFLWRSARALPERGRIGIFNRSYYEEVLVVRVHPEILQGQRLPRALVTKRIWAERYEDIRGFERYLARQGFVILKFFLHVSKSEQRRRFLERLDQPEKNWKFSMGDAVERKHWSEYMEAFEDAIRATATRHAPWYVVPSDKKWYARLVVAAAVHDALSRLDLAFPQLDERKMKELKAARIALLGKGDRRR
jgi:PPK2 family polyphosphate:nucleotide phosphotransferase